MKQVFWGAFLLATALHAFSAAAVAKLDNYVVFSVKGDCNQEDCIAVLKNSLKPLSAEIVSIKALSLIQHQVVDYKPITITFKNLKTAPYSQVVQRLMAQGYESVAYVIHDTHAGTDIIIPH